MLLIDSVWILAGERITPPTYIAATLRGVSPYSGSGCRAKQLPPQRVDQSLLSRRAVNLVCLVVSLSLSLTPCLCNREKKSTSV